MSSSSHNLFRDRSSHKGKRERTRSTLLDSAISVFASKGFAATKITDITSHAGLANGTFYNYYDDTGALLKDVADGLAIEVTGNINDEMQDIDNGIARVTVATTRILEHSRIEPDWLWVLLESIFIVPELQSATTQFLRQDLEIGVKQGHFTVELDVLLMNQITALVRVAILLDSEMSDETIRKTCEAILRLLGLSQAKAKKQVALISERYLNN